MYCQRCGAAEINGCCPKCGSVAGPSGFKATIPGTENPESSDLPTLLPAGSARPPGGVMGWLLVLCLSLTILGPFVQGRIAWTALRNLATTSITANGTMLRLSSVGAIYAGLSMLSFCAGLLLWLEEPWGVSVGKAYLWIAPTLVIPLYLILALGGLRVHLLRVVFGRLAYSVVSYAYLSTSKRVRETYFRPAA